MAVKPGYKQTEVGLIPEEWGVQPFQSLASIERGKFTPRPRNDPRYYGGDIPFIQTGDVANSNGEIIGFSQTLNREGLKVSKLFPQGTLFFTIAANIGDVGIATFDTACPDSLVVDHLPGPATLNSGVFVIRPKQSSYDPQFFYCVLTSRIFGDFLTKLQAGSTISHLYQKDFVTFSFLAPATLAEQTAIAGVLSDMDAEIAALEQRREKTRALKQGMMQELLTGRTRLV